VSCRWLARRAASRVLGASGGAGAVEEAVELLLTATPRVQELHLLAWHGICEVVEAAMVAGRELEKTGN
jgi:hypothetical protein